MVREDEGRGRGGRWLWEVVGGCNTANSEKRRRGEEGEGGYGKGVEEGGPRRRGGGQRRGKGRREQQSSEEDEHYIFLFTVTLYMRRRGLNGTLSGDPSLCRCLHNLFISPIVPHYYIVICIFFKKQKQRHMYMHIPSPL